MHDIVKNVPQLFRLSNCFFGFLLRSLDASPSAMGKPQGSARFDGFGSGSSFEDAAWPPGPAPWVVGDFSGRRSPGTRIRRFVIVQGAGSTTVDTGCAQGT